MYKWDKNAEKRAFVMPCHGDASKPTAAIYYWANPVVLRIIKSNIEEDKLSSETYKYVNTGSASSVSIEIRNPMQIYNLQKGSNCIPSWSEKNLFEINNSIQQIQENSGLFMHSMRFLFFKWLEHYSCCVCFFLFIICFLYLWSL